MGSIIELVEQNKLKFYGSSKSKLKGLREKI